MATLANIVACQFGYCKIAKRKPLNYQIKNRHLANTFANSLSYIFSCIYEECTQYPYAHKCMAYCCYVCIAIMTFAEPW